MSKKVLVICGATASGKSKLAIDLAQHYSGEIVSADSMQIYRDMNIGTAKVGRAEQDIVKHHMIDIISPLQKYSVAKYCDDARRVLRSLLDSDKQPIICGGTGQYINALVDHLEFSGAEISDDQRQEIAAEITADNCAEYHTEMQRLDPEHASKVASSDLKRIRRFFELYKSSGITISEANRLSQTAEKEFDFQVFCLLPEREKLYDSINLRTREMFAEGLVEETEQLLYKYPGVEYTQAFKAIGYNLCHQFINGELTIDQAIELTAQKTRNYAKRQYTWFKARRDYLKLEHNTDKFAKIVDVFKRD